MSAAAKGVSEVALKRAKEIEATQEEQRSMEEAEQVLNADTETLEVETSQEQLQQEEQPNEPETVADERESKAQQMLRDQRERRNMEGIQAQIDNGFDVSQEQKQKLADYKRKQFGEEKGELEAQKEEIQQLESPEEGEVKENVDENDENQEPEFEDTTESDVELSKPGFYGDKVLVKVDGQLREMTPEQALSIVQKNLAADKRLEMASQERTRLQQWEQRLQQQQENQHHAKQPPTPGVEQMSNAEIRDHSKKLIEMIEDGDTDKAAEELSRLIDSRQDNSPPVTPEMIQNQVQQQLNLEKNQSAERELKDSGEYDDIFNDPSAYQEAVQNVRYLKSQGRNGTVKEVMTEAMDMYRYMHGTTPAPKADTSQDERTNKKRKMPRTVSSASKVSPKAPVKSQEPSRAQQRASVFERAKAARNQN